MSAENGFTRVVNSIRGMFSRSESRNVEKTGYRMGDLSKLRSTLEKRYGPRAVNSFFSRGHYDAGSLNRFRDDWSHTGNVPYADIKADLMRIVARSRGEVSNNGIAQGIVNTIKTNVVGNGMWPKPNVKNEDGTPATDLNRALEDGWDRFVEQFDATGHDNFYQCQGLALETEIISGTVLVNKVNNPAKNKFLRIAYQMIEPDRLDYGLDDHKVTLDENDRQKQILHGIGLDEYYRPTRYYIKGVSRPVSASNMFHHYLRKRPEQVIGVPWLHASLPDLWDYRQLKEDNLIKSRILADIVLWMSNDGGDNPFESSLNASDDPDNFAWEPGSTIRSKNKPEIVQADDKIADALKPLLKVVLLDACSGAGISYMSVSRDMDGVNFAASRTNLTEDRRHYRTIQEHQVTGFNQKIYYEFVAQMALENKIAGFTPAVFNEDPYKYTRALWQAEGWDWVDPQNDANASKTMYETGLTNLKMECGKHGLDWREVIDQRAEEEEYARKKGVVLFPVGGKASLNGGSSTGSAASTENENEE